MDIHITNKTNKSWEIVYVIEKVRQLFSKHSQKDCFVGLVEGGTDRKKCSVLCCKVIDACTTSNEGVDNLVKGVQCYELFGGIALKNQTFSFHFIMCE